MAGNKLKVNISDAKVSSNPEDILVTYALGSCIGVCLYDPVIRVGGLLHYLLPNSEENPKKAKQNPFKYADTGMKALLEKLEATGAKKRRMKVKIAGGATALKIETKGFDIGKRNYLAIRKILWKNGMLINAESVGGSVPRTVYMNIEDGQVTIKSGISKMKL